MSGGFLFVSGQVGSRADGSPEPDLEAQLRLAFRNLEAVLAAGGCTFDDIVDFTCISSTREDAADLAKVRAEFLGEPPYPTLTGIGVTWLYGFNFELKVIAKLPEDAA